MIGVKRKATPTTGQIQHNAKPKRLKDNNAKTALRRSSQFSKPEDGYVAEDVRLLKVGELALHSGDAAQLAALHAPIVAHLTNACRQAKRSLPNERPAVDLNKQPFLTDEQYIALHATVKAILVGVSRDLPRDTLVDGHTPETFAQRLDAIPPFDYQFEATDYNILGNHEIPYIVSNDTSQNMSTTTAHIHPSYAHESLMWSGINMGFPF